MTCSVLILLNREETRICFSRDEVKPRPPWGNRASEPVWTEVEEEEEIKFVKLQRTVVPQGGWGVPFYFSSLFARGAIDCVLDSWSDKHPQEAVLRAAHFNARAANELINFIPALKKKLKKELMMSGGNSTQWAYMILKQLLSQEHWLACEWTHLQMSCSSICFKFV